jgi:sec-independent protein translocase protein TatA
MFGIGPMELVVIVVVALLIFGPQRLPELARTLGKGLAEVRRASNDLRHTLALDELQNDLRKTMNQVTSPPPAEPRPAQAGDTLPPGGASTAVAAAGAASSTADSATPEAPPWKSHPGQLPEGGDQDHNDVSPPADPSPAAPPRLAAADPGLGNVPVTGADPAETRRG